MASTAGSTGAGAALFGKVRRLVLSLLFGDSESSFYLSQIVQIVGAGKGAVQRELAGLTRARLLIRTSRGRQVYYQANKEAAIFEEVSGIVRKWTQSRPAGPARIALTGGPGGGKTTLLREIRSRDGGERRFLAVPEAATILLGAGLSRREKSFQLGIVRLQLAMEDAIAAAARPEQIVVCDRGTVDSLAYWRLNGWLQNEFFTETGLTHSEHLARYDAVIHLQTTAIGASTHYSRHGDVERSEELPLAARIDSLIAEAWAGHPRYHLVRNVRGGWRPKSETARRILDGLLTQAEADSARTT